MGIWLLPLVFMLCCLRLRKQVHAAVPPGADCAWHGDLAADSCVCALLPLHMQVHDAAPPGAKVLHGQKERENEAKYDERAIEPAKGLAAGACIKMGLRSASGKF
jgi:hypothetical protein